MKIDRFNESNNEQLFQDILNDIKDKMEVPEVIYKLYGVKVFDKNGKPYPKSSIIPDGVVADHSLEKCMHFKKLVEKDFDFLFIRKIVNADTILSDEEIDLILKSNKYNL